MSLKQNLSNTIEWLDNLGLTTLKIVETVLYISVVVNLFGIYWYLHLNKLAIALVIVIIILLTVTYIFKLRANSEKEVDEIMAKDKKEVKKKPVKKKSEDYEDDESEDYGDDDFGFGLPSADEFNKRLQKAIG